MNMCDKTSRRSHVDELDVASEMRELLGLAKQAEHQSSMLNSNLNSAASFLFQIVEKIQMLGMRVIQNAIDADVKIKQCNSDLISSPNRLSKSNGSDQEFGLLKYSVSSPHCVEDYSSSLIEACNKLSHQISTMKDFNVQS